MTTSRRLRVTLLAACSLAGVAAAAQPAVGSAATLPLGVYDCQAFNFATGFLDYKGSTKLLSGHRYQQAFDRHGSKLKHPTHGTYAIKGTKIRFKHGGNNGLVGLVHKPDKTSKFPRWDWLSNGKPSGITCYFNKNA